MAKRAGAIAVWARYGTTYAAEHWAQLVRVTHWTAADVQRDEELRRAAGAAMPDVVLDAFGDLLDALTIPEARRPHPATAAG